MVTWDEVFTDLMKDPNFKREYDALEGWYQAELARQESLDRAEEEEHRRTSMPPSQPNHLRPRGFQPCFLPHERSEKLSVRQGFARHSRNDGS